MATIHYLPAAVSAAIDPAALETILNVSLRSGIPHTHAHIESLPYIGEATA